MALADFISLPERDFYLSSQFASQPKLKYRWGRVQGVLLCAYGLFIIIPSLAAVNLAVIVFSALCIVSGIGLATRKRYGFALFYITLSCLAGFGYFATLAGVIQKNFEFYLRSTILLLFWTIPAGLYYPNRLQDFK